MMDYTSSSDDDEPEIETLDISNDQYYRPIQRDLPKTVETPILSKTKTVRSANIPKYGSKRIRHSLPAYDLWRPFYPTYMNEAKLRNFHRPKLRHYNNGPQASTHLSFPIKSLSRYIHRSNKDLKAKVVKAIDDNLSREQIIERLFHLRHARSLTAKTGELYLFEYCEEFPPVLSQIGMASNVTTYKYNSAPGATSKTKTAQTAVNAGWISESAQTLSVETRLKEFGFEENIKGEKMSKQIYFHQMRPNSNLQMIENNLYRAPIYKQSLSPFDFIIIRTRNSFYVRTADSCFTVGQTMTLATVPSPTEAQIHKFRCDFSNLHIHKLFRTSNTKPRTLDIKMLLKLFPDYHESVLVKRLKSAGAEIVKSNRKLQPYYRHIEQPKIFVQGLSNYGTVSLLELRTMVKPEYYCLNMAMLAARQRLRELNYSESMIHPQKGQANEIEPEILAAPWNTSKAIVRALKGQAFLDLKSHLIDPTGVREGFSCVSWTKSPMEEQQYKDLIAPADSSEGSFVNSQPALMKNPLRDKIVQQKLNRLATYQREAQTIFEIQANTLAIQDDITSDDDDDIDADSENISDSGFERDLDRLNKLVIENMSSVEINEEEEEQTRREMLSELGNRRTEKEENPSPRKMALAALKDKILMITRMYKYGDKTLLRTEIVREPQVIARYVQQKGGTVHSELKSDDLSNPDSDEAGGKHETSIMSTRSEGASIQSHIRPRAMSLGPSEVCRAEGTILRISKRVLDDCRPMRDCRR